MTFLPNDYNPPSTGGHYLKFAVGENKFRILDSPILGYQAWQKDSSGKDKPVRARMEEARPEGRDLKHFWCMPVWDYETHKICILEITQSTIQKLITSLAKSEDWGTPLEYDIVVEKKGSGMDTEYTVRPCPKLPLHPDISALWLELQPTLNMDALYEGGDPFGESPEATDDIPF